MLTPDELDGVIRKALGKDYVDGRAVLFSHRLIARAVEAAAYEAAARECERKADRADPDDRGAMLVCAAAIRALIKKEKT